MKEFRCIIFAEHEVVTAVIERKKRAHEPLPVGTVKDVEYYSVNTKSVVTRIRLNDDYNNTTTLVVSHDELTAAMILYCINRKIIMPHQKNRWVELVEWNNLTLFVVISHSITKKRSSRSSAIADKNQLALH